MRLLTPNTCLIYIEVPAALKGKGVGSATGEKVPQYAKDDDYTMFHFALICRVLSKIA